VKTLLFLLLSSVLVAAQTNNPGTTTKSTDDNNVERDFLEESTGLQITSASLGLINAQDGAITQENVAKLITTLFSDDSKSTTYAKTQFSGLYGSKGELNDATFKKTTFIINVVLWHGGASSEGKSSSTTSPDQRWYVYRDGKLTSAKRLMGVRRFYFMYLHLHRGATTYVTRYDFASTEATPIALDHLYTLASFVVGQQTAKRELAKLSDIWGGKQLDFDYSTSDIAVSSKITKNAQNAAETSTASTNDAASGGNGTANSGGSSAGTSGNQATDGALDTPQTFHNEAPPWWDVSVGFPVTNVSELKFDSSANGLTPTQIDKRRLFGLLNFFPLHQQRMQLAEHNFSWIPSLVVGLPLASQPLHKPVVGVGWGPPLLQFYVGSIIAKQPNAPSGSTLTKSACTGWCPQFTFGINFGVKALKDKLTKK
jgi:hypothetical protein